MRFGLTLLSLVAAIPVAAAAPGEGQLALATYHDKPYDVAANCLMKQMSSREIKAWPLVYAPPRMEALVNLWPRGDEFGIPIGVFHIKQNEAGATVIRFEETHAGRLGGLAQAAADRCAK